MKAEKVELTLYSKNEIIGLVSSMLKYYDKSEYKKEIVKAAHLLMDKVRYSDKEDITLESDFIEEILFVLNEDGTKSIVSDVYSILRSIGADLKGVSFDNVHISGYYFGSLKNVEINIQKIPNYDISNTSLKGVKVYGTLNGANIKNTDFTGYIGDLVLNPQLVQNKDLYFTNLNGITVNGSFDGVNVSCMKTEGFKGEIIINPQKVYNKDIWGIDMNGVQLIGDYNEVSGMYDDSCFEECRIYNTSFKGCIGNVVTPLDKLLWGANLCNFTGVKLTGNIKDAGCVQFSYYEDEDGNKIYLTYDKDNSEEVDEEEKIMDNSPQHNTVSKKKSRILTFIDRLKR